MEELKKMNRTEKQDILSKALCSSDTVQECNLFKNGICPKHDKCRIWEKTDEQLDYILSPIENCAFLKACAGSGKTEVLGMKAALEISRWHSRNSGIAILTFTNEATNTIKERISQLYPQPVSTFHFIGTFDSFIHGYIAQKFGYAFYRKGNQDKDKSFSLVSSDMKSYDNGWLKNFKVNFPTERDIYANQIECHNSSKMWYISLGKNNKKKLSEYYQSPKEKEIIDGLRKKYNNKSAYGFDFFKERVTECKLKFLEAGFATFEDMRLIARRCLKDEAIAKNISRKFPLIMIDECQDLSYIELEIINLIRSAGSRIHFIGDLNQAIYSFKDASPEFLKSLIENVSITPYELTDNFRSNQTIVDVACALQEIQSDIKGHAASIFEGDKAAYFEYENEVLAIQNFHEILNTYNIPKENAIVLARNDNLKRKLLNGTAVDYKIHPVISSLQLWTTKIPENQRIAMQLLGLQIQKWTKEIGRENNYYCPESIINTFCWRLMLRDVLNELVSNTAVNNFGGKTYSEWYKSAKKAIIDCVDFHIQKLCGYHLFEPEKISMITPKGTATIPIQKLNIENKNASIKVDTIHSTKGCTYDAVLLISTTNAKGTGYWEKWIDDKGETTRFAYVASTRPKHLLCWAVPKLNDIQRQKIESIGLKKYT